MKSGLEDRNNLDEPHPQHPRLKNVSMKSGLEDRNNTFADAAAIAVLGSSQ
ncbi:Uncharacterised protein [Arachnia propionica]|nr:Uncharacterised protein [Arachnia propionica]